MSDEKQYLERLSETFEEEHRKLKDQSLTERRIVAGLLRVLEVPYEDGEIRKAGKDCEPIDVLFKIADQEACFQVTVSYDKDRRLDAEFCEQVKKLAEAETILDTLQPVYLNPTALTPDQYFQIILCCSQDKLKKYGRVDGDIDLLVYINQRSTYLHPREPWPCTAPLRQHGWRSVTFVDKYSYAGVLYANEDAPCFLRSATGRMHALESGPGVSVFPQKLNP